MSLPYSVLLRVWANLATPKQVMSFSSVHKTDRCHKPNIAGSEIPCGHGILSKKAEFVVTDLR